MSRDVFIPPVSGGGGEWTTVEVTGSAVQSITVSGLDLDRDGAYEFYLHLSINNSGILVFRPNGLTSNLRCSGVIGPGPSQVTAASQLRIAGNGGVTVTTGYIRISGTTGFFRDYESDTFDQTGDFSVLVRGQWQETVTNLTSAVVFATNASSIQVGSIVKWRKSC